MTLRDEIRSKLDIGSADDLIAFVKQALPVVIEFFATHSKHGVEGAMQKLRARLDDKFDEAEAAIHDKHEGTT